MDKNIYENLDSLPEENRRRILETMKKYGDNHWWESENPVEIAKYQVFEDILMADFSIFHEGIEKLLGRPVYTHEFGLDIKGLREEGKQAIELLESSVKLDESDLGVYRDKRVSDRIQLLFDYAEKHGKKAITIYSEE